MPRVLFYVQHLMGIGHQKRASTITRAMIRKGLDVTYVSGGFPVTDLDVGTAAFLQLPPCKAADSTFLTLLDENLEPVTDNWKESRRQILLDALHTVQPDFLIIEMFPFGRRAVEFELIPLIEAARNAAPRSQIICSVRDIIDPKPKPGRYEEIASRLEAWFDLVLVHGDPQLIAFDAIFPLTSRIQDKLHYTGYIVNDSAAARGAAGRRVGSGEVIVTAGSGRVGEKIFETALKARAMSPLKDSVWRFLIGDGVSAEALEAYRAKAPSGVIIERFRADYPTLLSNAALSISRGGYNTVTDLLHAGTPAILIPFAEGIENEQLVRANALTERGYMQSIEQSNLTPSTLADRITQVLRGVSTDSSINLSGADTSAHIIADQASVSQS